MPRLSPVPEPIDEAWIGVTTAYRTTATPRELAAQWEGIDAAERIPATVTDPESSRSIELTAGQPVLRWENELAEDPAPVVRAIAIEPATVWVPLWSLVPLGGVIFFGWGVVFGRRRVRSLAIVRVMIAAFFVLGPVAGFALALPLGAGNLPDARPVRQACACSGR